MVLEGLTYTELNTILQENGWTIESDKFWEEHNRIIIKKDNESVILQFKSFYGFAFVVKFLTSLNIDPPEKCKKPYNQYMAYLNSQKGK
jgi:hypothetical protein